MKKLTEIFKEKQAGDYPEARANALLEVEELLNYLRERQSSEESFDLALNLMSKEELKEMVNQ